MFVFTLDPGKASGVLQSSYFDDEPLRIDKSYLLPFDLVGLAVDFSSWVMETDGFDRRVIYEKWQDFKTAHSTDSSWAQHNIGVLLYLSQLHDIPVHGRRPGVPKIPTPLLRQAGYWVSGKGDDQMSAVKHTLQQLCDERHIPTRDRLWAPVRNS